MGREVPWGLSMFLVLVPVVRRNLAPGTRQTQYR